MNRFWKKRLPALLMVLALSLSFTATAVESVVPPAHQHAFSTIWGYDNTQHWRTCSVTGCKEKSDVGNHDFQVTSSKNPTCYQDGEIVSTCSVCKCQKKEIIAATGQHTFSGSWQTDAVKHWHTCTTPGCTAVGDSVPHTAIKEGMITLPTCTTKGSIQYTCEVCAGRYSVETSPALGHSPDVNGRCTRCGIQSVTNLTVTFQTGSASFSQTIAQGGRPAKPSTPSMSGSNRSYSFRGWTTSATNTYVYTGQSLTEVENTVITGNTTYYAVYVVSATAQDVSVLLDSVDGITADSATSNSSSLRNQMNSRFSSAVGSAFRYARFGSASGTDYGRMYTNRDKTSLSTNTNYYYNSSSYGSYPLANVYFQPGDTKGTFAIAYSAYDEFGNSASGMASFVTGKAAASGAIVYTVDPGREIAFDRADFNRAYQTEFSGSIRYVTFETSNSLSSSGGTVYYDYNGRDATEFSRTTLDDYKFYYNSESYGDYDLSRLSFVASSNFHKSVTLTFRAYGAGGGYVDGTVEIRSGDASGDGTIVYTVKPSGEVALNREDFNKAFQREYSGTARYVIFGNVSALIPANGRLYCEYGRSGETEFSQTTVDDYDFYYNSSSYGDYDLDKLSFVASADFKTTVKLPYRVYGPGGDYVDGTVEIRSGNSAATEGDIAYTADPGEEISFDADAFNALYQKEYSGNIRYVTFESASTLTASNGRLYYDYDGSREEEFTKSTLDDYRFYYEDATYGDYNLGRVSFVASDDFKTAVTLTFRAYYSSSKYVDGTLTIRPAGGASSTGGDILYATTYSAAVQINANDIARFFSKSYPNYDLDYVELSGVPVGGNLYYNYYGASKYGTASRQNLTASNCDDQRLYFSPTSTRQYALSELTYVPSGVNYCARIPFTAYGGSSRSVSGTILISVNVSVIPEVYGVTPKGTNVTLPATAIYSAVSAGSGMALASIQFLSLPASSVGTLYVGSGTTHKANLSTKYGYSAGTERMNQLRFVPAGNFIGSVELPYVACNANGNPIASGKFCLGVVNRMSKYADMPASSWCYKYVMELSDAKVIGGYKNNTYRPNNTVTYGEALKLILLASGYSVQTPTDTHWASGYLSKAKANGLLSGIVNLDAPITRLAVAQIAAKAMKLNTDQLSSVKPFTDTTDVYVQALNAAGIVEGYFAKGTSTFKPNNTLTRGQISAIVWRMGRNR